MPRSAGEGLRWSAERRLRFIDLRLFWEGRLNRRDLRHSFGISDQQASADISLYQQRAPGNCTYDRAAKAYMVGGRFKPMFGPADAQLYLNELRSVDYGLINRSDSWIARFPDFETVPHPKRSVDAEILRSVLRSIRACEALEVKYQSLSRPQPVHRWITPHAFGYDGHRWHARAFCHTHGDFRDFVLARILSIRGVQHHELSPELDLAWQEKVDLLIGTHPGLPEEQRKAVELDYEMKRGQLGVPVRVALAQYLMRWMRLDLDPAVVRPEQIQIVFLNRADVGKREQLLKIATADHIKKAGIQRLAPAP